MLFADWSRVCSVSVLAGMLWDPKAMTKPTLSLCQSLSLGPSKSWVPFQLSLYRSDWPQGAFKPNNCLYGDSLAV